MRLHALTVLAVSVALAGCRTIAPASRTVDPDTLPNCIKACKQVGMKVGGIVFVSEIGGCVCEPEVPTPKAGEKAETAPRAGNGASAVASGALLIILAAQQEQQRNQTNTSSIGHR